MFGYNGPGPCLTNFTSNHFNDPLKATKFNTLVNNKCLLDRSKTIQDIKFPHGSAQTAFADLHMTPQIMDTIEVQFGDIDNLQNRLTPHCTITGEEEDKFIVDDVSDSDDKS